MDLRSAADPLFDPAAEKLIEEARPRGAQPPHPRERITELVAAGGFVAAAGATALLVPGGRDLDPLLAVALVALLASASRIRFDVGAGYSVPTQLVFVPMLFVLPLGLVAPLVALSFAAGKAVDAARGDVHVDRVLTTSVADGWHSLGPVVVLGLAGAPSPSWGDWPLYAAALAAQLGVDLVSSVLRERFALGVAPSLQMRVLAGVCLVDALLSPVGLVVAFAAAETPYAALLVGPLYLLLSVFSRERDAHIESALELSSTYRGTAMLLGDVLEGTDQATGVHSRSVLGLSLELADRLGLDARQRRNVEFAALLHDIGKIVIPLEVLHKRGPLDGSEWRVMRTHTLEGHRMLRMVGGALEEVGRIVRATHERWDGRGYPDGLRGDEIPIEACVVATCDAFDAMTNDRPYRHAMTLQSAIAELRAHAGTQFHPGAVDVLVAILERNLAVGDPAPETLPALVDTDIPRSQRVV